MQSKRRATVARQRMHHSGQMVHLRVQLTSLARHHPYRLVAVVEGGVIVVYLLARGVAALADVSAPWPTAIAYAAMSIVVVVVLRAMGWGSRIGLHRLGRRRDALYFLPALLPVLINVGAGLEISSLPVVAGLLLLALMVGIVEESVFRGLILRALEPRGVRMAVLVSALLFGLSHLLTLLAGKSLVDAGAQAFYATALGFAFAALVWRTGVIWPLIAIHALIDLASFLQKPTETTAHASPVIVIVVALVYGSYGLLLLRGAGRRTPDVIRTA